MPKNRIVKSFILVVAVCSLLFNGIETAASEGGTEANGNVILPTASEEVISVLLPTIGAESPFDFYIDPLGLIFATGAAKYGGGVVEEGAHLLFWNHEEGQYDFSRNSDRLTVINESTVPVKIRITAEISGMGDSVLSQNEDLSGIDGCAVYLALTDDEGNELPLSEDGEVSMEIEMQKAPEGAYTWQYNDKTDQYEYGYLAREEIEFDQYSFGLHGECNASDAWGKGSVSPKVSVTWSVEPVMSGEDDAQEAEETEKPERDDMYDDTSAIDPSEGAGPIPNESIEDFSDQYTFERPDPEGSDISDAAGQGD